MPYPDFPVYLGEGQIAIYGLGSQDPVSDLVPPEGFLWGTVYHIFNGGGINVVEGDTVLFNNEKISCRLAVPSGRYTLIKEEAIIATEKITIAP